MKTLTVKSLLVTTLVASSSVYASCDKLTCDGVTNTVLSTMQTTKAGTYVTFPAGTDEALDCALVDGSSALLDTAHPHYKSMHSLLLTAVASNLSIELTFSPDYASCSLESAALKVAE